MLQKINILKRNHIVCPLTNIWVQLKESLIAVVKLFISGVVWLVQERLGVIVFVFVRLVLAKQIFSNKMQGNAWLDQERLSVVVFVFVFVLIFVVAFVFVLVSKFVFVRVMLTDFSFLVQT